MILDAGRTLDPTAESVAAEVVDLALDKEVYWGHVDRTSPFIFAHQAVDATASPSSASSTGVPAR